MSSTYTPQEAAGPSPNTTAHTVSESDTLKALLGADTNEILDLVDQLRQKGIKDEVPLPQIIVVGDQSSGKSSVLEALSRLQFPRGSTLCTTFATELALRRKPTPNVRAIIEPSPLRSEDEQQKLKSWIPGSTNLDEFQAIVTSAGELIRSFNHGSKDSYSQDVLRVEVSGPDYPDLTLVDLPGLTRGPNVDQSPDDPETCRKIVESYMINPSSIILAILDAAIEEVRQDPLNLVKKHDPDGIRTIGVITKPDRASEAGIDEDYMDYARNLRHQLKYGWHVLKNRDKKSGSWSAEQRDAAEAEFFKTSNWKALDPSQLGAGSLRMALSRHLEVKIRETLPTMVTRIQNTLKHLERERERLGPSRTSSDEQRRYLDKIADAFASLVKTAVDGFGDDSFDATTSTGYPTLRSHAHALSDIFIQELKNSEFSKMVMGESTISTVPNPFDAIRTFAIEDELVQYAETLHRGHRGRDYQRGIVDRTHLSSVLLREVTRIKTNCWRDIAEQYIQSIGGAVRQHIIAIANHTAGEQTAKALISNHLEEALAEKDLLLQEKLDELLMPIQQTQSSGTISLLWDSAHRDLLTAVAPAEHKNHQGDTRSDYELAIREAALRYVIALGTFMDNVNLLAVEMIMLKPLPDIFNSSKVAQMPEEKLQYLAAEPLDTQHKRRSLNRKITEFQESIKLCRWYAHGSSAAAINRTDPVTPMRIGGNHHLGANLPPLHFSERSPSPRPVPSPLTPPDVPLIIGRGKEAVTTGSPRSGTPRVMPTGGKPYDRSGSAVATTDPENSEIS